MEIRNRLLCTLSLAVAMLVPGAVWAEAQVIFLSRHAEKAATGTDPARTTQGQLRAQNVAATLRRAGIKNVYSTAYVRTQQTAAPLASALALPVQTYDATPSGLAAFAQLLKNQGTDAMVVGHSDTTPELIRLLGGDPGSEIPETEFDRLYQVTISPEGVTTVLLNSLPSAAPTVPCESAALNKPNLSAAIGVWTYHTIAVPDCANTLTVTTSGGSGDADLFVRLGSNPTTTTNNCKSEQSANTESCVVPNPAAGVWHIGIRAYKAYSGLTLNAVATP